MIVDQLLLSPAYCEVPKIATALTAVDRTAGRESIENCVLELGACGVCPTMPARRGTWG
jgi:hypothetical protein